MRDEKTESITILYNNLTLEYRYKKYISHLPLIKAPNFLFVNTVIIMGDHGTTPILFFEN
jgi:hypothetical protein